MNHWQVLIQSFSADSLQKVHALDPQLPLIFLGNPSVANIPHYAAYAVGLGPSFGSSINANWVNTAHANCLDVHPYTINTAANMTAALNAGVDGMFTNFSDILIGLLGPRKAVGLQGAWTRSSRTTRASPAREGHRRRHRARDARADPRRARELRRVRPGRRGGLRRVDHRERRLHGRERGADDRRPEQRHPRASSSTARSACRRASWPRRPARSAPRRRLAAVGGSAAPTTLLNYAAPVSNDAVTIDFKQSIGATDALRTGQYAKTLTLTLSTTHAVTTAAGRDRASRPARHAPGWRA